MSPLHTGLLALMAQHGQPTAIPKPANLEPEERQTLTNLSAPLSPANLPNYFQDFDFEHWFEKMKNLGGVLSSNTAKDQSWSITRGWPSQLRTNTNQYLSSKKFPTAGENNAAKKPY